MKLIDIYSDLKQRYNFDIVAIQSGFYFNIFNEDAEYFKKKFKFKTYEQGQNIVTGFPTSRIDNWEEKFKLLNLTYAFVEQDNQVLIKQKKIRRIVTRSNNPDAIDALFEKISKVSKIELLTSRLGAITNGFDPFTGEIFSEQSVLRDPEVVKLVSRIIA